MVGNATNQGPSQEETEAAEPKVTNAMEGVKKPAKKTTGRRSRAKATKEVRLRAFWGVFSQSLNAVVLFDYGERNEAQKKAKELSESRKSPHFVQLIKKAIEE
ncbi:MAG: hypothetical protein A2V98_24945 [Planctomycetes bacterium RBG_16_64_12]|nr:MAG: hypothetical protein A2V98_24945 [Planctomycetes bacterium RBG_16_64_12]